MESACPFQNLCSFQRLYHHSRRSQSPSNLHRYERTSATMYCISTKVSTHLSLIMNTTLATTINTTTDDHYGYYQATKTGSAKPVTRQRPSPPFQELASARGIQPHSNLPPVIVKELRKTQADKSGPTTPSKRLQAFHHAANPAVGKVTKVCLFGQ